MGSPEDNKDEDDEAKLLYEFLAAKHGFQPKDSTPDDADDKTTTTTTTKTKTFEEWREERNQKKSKKQMQEEQVRHRAMTDYVRRTVGQKKRDASTGPLARPFTCSLILSHRSLIHLLCSARAPRCAHLLALLILELVGKRMIRCLKTTWFCPTLRRILRLIVRSR